MPNQPEGEVISNEDKMESFFNLGDGEIVDILEDTWEEEPLFHRPNEADKSSGGNSYATIETADGGIYNYDINNDDKIVLYTYPGGKKTESGKIEPSEIPANNNPFKRVVRWKNDLDILLEKE